MCVCECIQGNGHHLKLIRIISTYIAKLYIILLYLSLKKLHTLDTGYTV